MDDLSVLGARLLIPLDDRVLPRRKIEVELGGTWTCALIAWVQPAENTPELWCGVMFLDPGPDFLAAIVAAMLA